MTEQFDLFVWAESRPSAQIIDATPILFSRAARGLIRYEIQKVPGKIIEIRAREERGAA